MRLFPLMVQGMYKLSHIVCVRVDWLQWYTAKVSVDRISDFLQQVRSWTVARLGFGISH